MPRGQHIQLILIAVQLPIHNPKAHPAHKTQYRANPIIPHQQRIIGKIHKRLSERRADRRHKQVKAHHKTAHVAGGFGERVFQRGDAREDFRNSNEDVRACLRPDVDFDDGVAGSSVVAAVGLPVDILLEDGGPDHGCCAGEKPERDFLDGGEVDAHFPQARVDEAVDDRDQDDQSEGVEVGEDVVGDVVERHSGRLRG